MPLVSPVTLALVALAPAVTVFVASVVALLLVYAYTVYPVIALPPFPGALHVTLTLPLPSRTALLTVGVLGTVYGTALFALL